ncbi:Inosine-5'-monophosphate dehydrogenase [uncultured archaeon]|nr:Inosine-5'-monophosphate dehydrogenase [uncultured archaeon]
MRIEDDGFTFDDVLIIPKITDKAGPSSRKDVDTSVNITARLKLHAPIISANMDTVTEARMAITMARLGGAGVIHRFNTISGEAEEVRRVKRAQSVVIENPYTVSQDVDIEELRNISAEKGVTSFPVLDGRKVIGIVTRRDYRFEKDKTKKVSEIMTRNVITSGKDVTTDDAKAVFAKNKIEKLLLVDHKGNLVGMITAKDIGISESYTEASKDRKGRLLVGASIGISGDYKERLDAMVEAEADFIVIDIANGYLTRTADTIRYVKKSYDIEVMAGNVATKDGALNLAKAGADCVKVGIGPGSACLTRPVAGVGYPQLSAIIGCADIGVPIIADGGVNKSADLAKAIAGGASAVMIGGLIAGTDESPGTVVSKAGSNYKFYRGMASVNAYSDKSLRMGEEVDIGDYTPEGTETLIPYKGSAAKIINNFIGGLRSAMTYVNAPSIAEFQKRAEFVKITEAGKKESKYV